MLIHFPDKIVPKAHFIREYERIVHDYGSAAHQWCSRYEACHTYFKKLAIRTNNCKNTPKMLATHFRLNQCLKFTRLSQFKSFYYFIGIKKIQHSSFNIAMKNVLVHHFGYINLNNDLFQCTKLINENIEYCRSAVYIINLRSDNEQPLFTQVIFILKMNEKWCLLVDLLNTLSCDEDLFAWKVKSVDRYSILDPSQLKYYYKGLDIYLVKGSSFVSFTSRLTSYHHDILPESADSSSTVTKDPQSSSITSIHSQPSSITSIHSQPSSIITTYSQSSTFTIESSTDCLPKSSTNNSISHQRDNSANINVPFPDEYRIPSLPNGLIKDIEAGSLHTFGPRYTNRQTLIDAISYDLIEKYKLFYPSSKQFDKIGNAIVKFLKLPLIKENIAIWKDALQAKLKRKRAENLDNIIVQDYHLKYSRAGSGRPVKRRLDETA
ncbi:unnamed protein product [Rotaria socialis]|uniref:Uncharacterized protein n=1 Tax=Rotaria socialis TaxID=392032 RepID=A0A818NA63_9BILA|nr:unnamed protein product [Rotaria socialis]